MQCVLRTFSELSARVFAALSRRGWVGRALPRRSCAGPIFLYASFGCVSHSEMQRDPLAPQVVMGMIISVVCLFCGLMAAFLFPIVLLVETVSPDVARPAFAFRLPTLEWRSAPANLPKVEHARQIQLFVGTSDGWARSLTVTVAVCVCPNRSPRYSTYGTADGSVAGCGHRVPRDIEQG
jgi:hypothetical protein